MNKFDEFLAKTPAADTSWHCPWFWLVMWFCANATVFGLLSYFVYGADLGLFAVGVAIGSGAFALGARTRGNRSC